MTMDACAAFGRIALSANTAILAAADQFVIHACIIAIAIGYVAVFLKNIRFAAKTMVFGTYTVFGTYRVAAFAAVGIDTNCMSIGTLILRAVKSRANGSTAAQTLAISAAAVCRAYQIAAYTARFSNTSQHAIAATIFVSIRHVLDLYPAACAAIDIAGRR